MKYHYQVVSSFDPTDIAVDSRENLHDAVYLNIPFSGFDKEETADEMGEISMQIRKLNPDQYYVKVIPVPENTDTQ